MTTDNPTLEHLEARLHRGWDLIERAQSNDDADAVSRYTRLWMSLLADYERLAQETSPAPNDRPQE